MARRGAAWPGAERPDLQAVVLGEMERQWRDLRRRWRHHKAFFEMVARDLGEGES